MKNLKELSEIINSFYESQIRNNRAKNFEDCPYPCIPIASIPPHLKSEGIDWRKDYGYDKLTDLIRNLDDFELYIKGVPYVYLCKDGKKQMNSRLASQGTREPKPYEIRNAYRKLASKPEKWIPIESLMAEVKWHGTTKQFTEKYKLQSTGNFVRVHNISKYEIVDDIYFDPEKNSFPSKINELREMALGEDWDDNKKPNKLLDNYLCYTYARVKDEKKISMSKDNLHACWNTGLVDYRYEPIYCYMVRKDTTNRWMFKSFCIQGEDFGKEMIDNISEMPKRAMYFDENNLLCQPTVENLSVDKDHIIREHPSRLSPDWLKQALGKEANWQSDETATEYDKRISALLQKGSQPNLHLNQLLKEAISESVKRCQWNYKTAIPYYEPISKQIGWFLPLCIQENDNGKIRLKPFAALVVTKGNSGRFQGETIYRLSWAYRCARLVCRPDSDWLTPLFSTDEKIDTDD